MAELNKLDIGNAIGEILSYIFKNIPTIVKATAIPTLLFTILTFYWFLPKLFPFIADMVESVEYNDEGAIVSSLIAFFGAIFILFLLSLVMYGMTLVPLLRNIILGESVGILRMDGLVFRAMVGMIIIFGIIYGIAIAIMIPVTIVQVFVENGGNEAGAVFLEGIGTLIMYIVMFFVMIKTSLILPDIVASERLRIAPGWRASKGNFWQMFVTYLVAYIVMTMIMYVLVFIAIFLAGIAIASNNAVTNMDWDNINLDMVANAYAAVMYSPTGFLLIIVFALISMIGIGTYASMFGTVYRMIVGANGESQSHTSI